MHATAFTAVNSRHTRLVPQPSAALPRAPFAGQAMFAGSMGIVGVPRQALLRMLPRSVALSNTASSQAPCLLIFGEQSEGSVFWGGVPIPWGVRYHELMVAVPFVRLRDASEQHLFIAGMTCDFVPAVWSSNTYYGFSKRSAEMEWDGKRFSAMGTDGRNGFSAIIQTRATASIEQLAWITSAAALPVLGRLANGRLVKSRFEWSFDEARIEQGWVKIEVGPNFPELRLESQNVQGDTFIVRRMRWRVSWPLGMI